MVKNGGDPGYRGELGVHIYRAGGVPSARNLPSSGSRNAEIGKTEVAGGGMEGG